MICKDLSLLCLCLLLIPSFSLFANDPWTTIEEEFREELSVRLEIREGANPMMEEWLGLALSNHGEEDLAVVQAYYRLELKAYAKDSDTPVKTGSLTASPPSDFTGQGAQAHLPPGTTHSRTSISAQAAALLGFPDQHPWKVRALLYLDLQVAGKKDKQISWPELEFTFMWYPPAPAAAQTAVQELKALLYRPKTSPFQHQHLQRLLQNPVLKDQLEVNTLIKAIQIRKGKEDGRIAIVEYLNRYFPQEEKIIQHYRKLLFQKDHQALIDLTAAPNIWDDRLLEPIISWFQQGNSGAMFRIMDMMYAHQNNWIQKQGIATIFSDLILYRYEDIIHKPHTELSDRQLLVWSSAAQLLGKTGNPEVIEILQPFLKCKTEILPKAARPALFTQPLPPPLRVADVALEGLLFLQQTDLEKQYRNAGYFPPYPTAEAELVITEIRDQMIGELLTY